MKIGGPLGRLNGRRPVLPRLRLVTEPVYADGEILTSNPHQAYRRMASWMLRESARWSGWLRRGSPVGKDQRSVEERWDYEIERLARFLAFVDRRARDGGE